MNAIIQAKRKTAKALRTVYRSKGFHYIRRSTGERIVYRFLVADCACCGSSDISDQGDYHNVLVCSGCADEDHCCYAEGSTLAKAVENWNDQQWEAAGS